MKKIIATAALAAFVVVGAVQIPFSQISADLHDPVVAHVYAHVANIHDAEDICQEVLIVISRAAGRGKEFAGAEHLRAFAFRTANNLLLHFYRDQSKSAVVDQGLDVAVLDPVIDRAMHEGVFDPTLACDRMLAPVPCTHAAVLRARLRGEKVPRRAHYNAKEAAARAWKGKDFFEAM